MINPFRLQLRIHGGIPPLPYMPPLYLFHFTFTSAFLNLYVETQIWVTELLCLGQETICMSIFQNTHTHIHSYILI